MPDQADGTRCDENSDCISPTCSNGFCCSGGTCCSGDTDCPGYPGTGLVCSTPSGCQGTRGTIECDEARSQCVTMSGLPDDGACDTTTRALTCGFFADVYCAGGADQPMPACPDTCTTDAECDANAHCDLGACFPDVPNGNACDEDSDCTSAHCANGFCCADGDCCARATDCPSSYSTAPTCDDLRGCQGTRDAAACVANRCETTLDVADDSACTSAIEADTCGSYPTVRCTGAVSQTTPVCRSTCAADSDCDANAHCDDGACLPDLPSGTRCDEASDCISSYCGNGFCCASGNC
jgi:hypothetical protein